MADVIGEAVTDLMISREINEIYTPKIGNSWWSLPELWRIAWLSELPKRMKALPALSYDELYRLIEKALAENDAYDVAKPCHSRSERWNRRLRFRGRKLF